MKWVPRSQWGARKAEGRTVLRSPQGLTYHYVAGPKMGTFSHATCATRVRNIQNFHMDTRDWVDIAYNTLTCPHGYVYEGRGWGVRSAANGTNTGNDSAYANCHLCGVDDILTPEGEQSMRDVLVAARTIGGAGPRIWVHRDWKSTGCPGDVITDFVRTGGLADASAPPPETGDDEMQPHQEALLRDVHEWLSREIPAIHKSLAALDDRQWRTREEVNKGRREQEAQAAAIRALIEGRDAG